LVLPSQAAETVVSSSAALTGVVMVAGGLALTPLAVLATRTLVGERRVFFARWRFLHLFAVLLFTVAATTLVGAALTGSGLELNELLIGQVATALGLGCGALAIVRTARNLDPEGVASLGLRRGGNLRAAFAGLAAYLLCAPALVGAMLAWPWLYEQLGGQWEQQPIVTRLAELEPVGVAAMVVLAVVVQPLLEEVLFRSFIQPLLVQNLGDRGGIVLTSVLFAGLHGGSAFLPVFGLSLLLGALMLRSQRLSAVAAVHAVHNGVMLSLVFLAPEVGGGLPAEPSTVGIVPACCPLP